LETSTSPSQIDVGVAGPQYDAAVSVLTRYLLTVVTEELQEADPEDWRSSIAIALKDATRRAEMESLIAGATSFSGR
jgi:hypothetical protein